MRLSRLLPVVAVASLVVTSVSPASAAEPGVGSTAGTLTVLGLDAGDVLDLELLSDFGMATIDPDEGDPSAAAALSALKLVSALLGVDQEVPLLEVSSTGDEDTANQDTTALPSNQLVGGSLLPASLRALVDDDGALSSVGAGIADLAILEGLLGVSSTELGFDGTALTTQSDGTRTMSLDGLSALDLEALLAGLGVPLTDLPLDTVLGLLDQLGLTEALEPVLTALQDALDSLGIDIDLTDLSAESISDILDAVPGQLDVVLDGVDTTTVTEEICTPLTDLLGQLVSEVCETVETTVDTAELEAIIGQVEGLIDGLVGDVLDEALGLLGAATLLSLDAFDVELLTTATDSVETSVADVTATLGGLSVGNLDLGNLDLLGPVAQVNGVVSQLEGTLSGILGEVHPMLGDLISVEVLDEVTSVTEEDGVVSALASFTGLEISLAPVDVEALIASLAGQTSIGDQLAGLGLPLPGGSSILDLNDVLSAAAPGSDLVTALSGGATMQLASVSQESTYEVLSASTPAPSPGAPGAPAPSPTLPRTGGDAAWLLFAGLAAVGALGLRRVVRLGGTDA